MNKNNTDTWFEMMNKVEIIDVKLIPSYRNAIVSALYNKQTLLTAKEIKSIVGACFHPVINPYCYGRDFYDLFEEDTIKRIPNKIGTHTIIDHNTKAKYLYYI